MTSIEEILAVAEDPAHVRTVTVRVLLRQDLVTRHAELDAELEAAARSDDSIDGAPRVQELARRLAALEAESDAAKIPFTFRSIGHREWQALLAKHPPSKQQRAAGAQFNPETFPAAAVAAAACDPVMTPEDAQRLECALNLSQFDALWAAALGANLGGLDDPKSRAAGMILRRSGESGISAAATESLEASSLDES